MEASRGCGSTWRSTRIGYWRWPSSRGDTALAGTWTAGRLGNRASSAILGLLLVAAVITNIVQVPYPIWFKVVILIVVPFASAWGYRLSSRRSSVRTAASNDAGGRRVGDHC
jgi:uncharacterized membrane protein